MTPGAWLPSPLPSPAAAPTTSSGGQRLLLPFPPACLPAFLLCLAVPCPRRRLAHPKQQKEAQGHTWRYG